MLIRSHVAKGELPLALQVADMMTQHGYELDADTFTGLIMGAGGMARDFDYEK